MSLVILRKTIGRVRHPKLYECSVFTNIPKVNTLARRHFVFVKDERSKCELYKVVMYLP